MAPYTWLLLPVVLCAAVFNLTDGYSYVVCLNNINIAELYASHWVFFCNYFYQDSIIYPSKKKFCSNSGCRLDGKLPKISLKNWGAQNRLFLTLSLQYLEVCVILGFKSCVSMVVVFFKTEYVKLRKMNCIVMQILKCSDALICPCSIGNS